MKFLKEVDILISISCPFSWNLPENLNEDDIQLVSKDTTALFVTKRKKKNNKQ